MQHASTSSCGFHHPPILGALGYAYVVARLPHGELSPLGAALHIVRPLASDPPGFQPSDASLHCHFHGPPSHRLAHRHCPFWNMGVVRTSQ
ncbi:uncharacterized protein EI90DRAFT_3091025 [Cantharellus anzutake]|uniref:uncharacterized protein n=1 Tax=Cantharellus anzutake TaxID=1750568 RepID=UPI00190432C2|nr:uncharacterized protein EI90DRAFT_3091025 [Cantharellus anzutake]KAF8314130.1 hypothetical protein EI90DRAFT_3091025 [Cantharellus anzutake]